MNVPSLSLLIFNLEGTMPAVRLGIHELLTFIKEQKHESKFPGIDLSGELEDIHVPPLVEVVFASSLVIYVAQKRYIIDAQPISGMSKLLTAEPMESSKKAFFKKFGVSDVNKFDQEQLKTLEDIIAFFIVKVVPPGSGQFLYLAKNSTMYFLAARIYLSMLLLEPEIEFSIRPYMENSAHGKSSVDWLLGLKCELLHPVDIDGFNINNYRERVHFLLELALRRSEINEKNPIRWLNLALLEFAKLAYQHRTTVNTWANQPEKTFIVKADKRGLIKVDIDHPDLQLYLDKDGLAELVTLYHESHPDSNGVDQDEPDEILPNTPTS